MTPSISVRESIRWIPEPPTEPTSTLVLTSAENRFVDVRIFKLPSGADTSEANQDVIPSSRLEWAFAGTSSTKLIDGPHGEHVLHSRWFHWVDSSRHPGSEEVNDEGDMFPQPDGRTLERGSMENPATGKVTEYEEVWKDVAVVGVTADAKGSVEDYRNACVVLLMEDAEHQARGMVVRIGQFCQGVLRVGERFSVERWEWKGAETGWKRIFRIGDLWLPCGVAIEGERGRVKLGGEVRHGEFKWRAVEMSSF